MKSFVLDTNAFLRFLLNDVSDQAEEVSKLFIKAKVKELEIFIPQIVVFEIEFALDKYYKFPKEEVIDKLSVLLVTSYVKVQDGDIFKEALELFKKTNLDFVDCFLQAYSKHKDSQLFTFDKDLKQLSLAK